MTNFCVVLPSRKIETDSKMLSLNESVDKANESEPLISTNPANVNEKGFTEGTAGIV